MATYDSTQPHEIRAWLGEDWTDEQVEQIIDTYDSIDRRLTLAGVHMDDDERGALLTIIAQRVDDALDRGELVDTDLRAQLAADDARRLLQAAVRTDVAAGMSEVQASKTYGVNRLTVRKWLGKDRA